MPKKSITSVNLSCRACLSTEGTMNSLFDPLYEGLSLADILNYKTIIQVDVNDGLPSQVCENCTAVLTVFYRFINTFQENEKYFKALITDANLAGDFSPSDQEVEFIKLETADIKCEFIDVNDSEEKDLPVEESIFICSEDMDTVKYYCEECEEHFSLQPDFQQHMLEIHKTEVNFEKEFSEAATDIGNELEAQKIKSSEIKNSLHCRHCESTFDTFAEYNKHCKTHKRFVCEQCGLAFWKKSNLSDHAVIHSTERRRVCPICGKAYKTRSALSQHKKSHENLRQNVCEKCGKAFNTRGTLNGHILLKHTNKKEHTCSVCGISFAVKSWLNKHMLRRHSKERERNYVCSICGMAYYEKVTLNRHLLVKHSDKRHSCTTCGKHYTTTTNLNKHYRRHHGITINKEGIDSAPDIV